MRDPIRDETVRDELDSLGMKHFLDVRATVRRVLETMHQPQRTAFAVAVTERMLRTYEAGVPGTDEPSAESVARWRRVADAVWAGLAGDKASSRAVAQAIGHLYLSPGFAESGHDQPADGQDHVVMAALYTAESHLHGCAEFANWVGWRGFDVATIRAAADLDWPHRRPAEVSAYSWELAHPAVQSELDRQLADMELLDELGDVLSGTDGDHETLLARLRNSG